MSATALINKSIRTIEAELHFLADSNQISTATLQSILSQLPEPSGTPNVRAIEPSQPALLPVGRKTTQQATPPPEDYPPTYTPTTQNTLNPSQFYATALWAYPGTADGDLAFSQGAKILVLKKENAEWWSGQVVDEKSLEVRGEAGIFPCSYVKPDQVPEVAEKAVKRHIPGDMGTRDMLVSSDKKSEGDSAGKRFGKKLGNAAVFGAGASIGGKIVNGIF